MAARLPVTFAALLCSVALGGCSGGEPQTVQGAAAPPPPAEIVVVNHGLDEPPQDESTVLAPTELKPDETTIVVQDAPLQEGIPQPLTTPEAALAPAVETPAPALESDRIAELEKQVAALRADYNAMMPAFNGLITTNERIKTLLDQLEQKAGVAPAAKPAVKTPAAPAAQAAPEKAPETPVSAAPAAAGDVAISGVRIGEHGDKSRIVLDISAAAEYRTAIDDAAKTLTITVPSAGWAGKDGPAKLKSALISGWTAAAADGGGVAITVQLKAPAKVVASEMLKAEGAAPARIVLDIAAEKPAS